jgi:DNA-binding Lrp family transcriptional regulator
MKAGLDSVDLRILDELQRDGRISNQRLSERVGLSPRACLERLHKLEKARIIQRYQAILDLKRLGGASIFLAEVTLVNHAAKTAERFERTFKSLPEVAECYLVGGEFDYFARIVCRDAEQYQELTQSWIDDSSLGIAKINSRVVLKTIRDFSGYALETLAGDANRQGR